MNKDDLLRREKYKSDLSGAERLEKYLQGEPVDHQPLYLHYPDYALANVLGFSTRDFEEDFEVFESVMVYNAREYFSPWANVRLSLRTLGQAAGSDLVFPKNGIDYVSSYFLEDYDRLKNLKDLDPYKDKVLSRILSRAYKLKERNPDLNVTTGVAGPLTTAVSLRPYGKLMEDLKTNSENLKSLLTWSVENSLKWIEVFTRELGPGLVSISDPMSSLDVLDLKDFRKFSYPYLKTLVDETKKISKKKAFVHICGKTQGLWPDLLNLDLGYFSLGNTEDLKAGAKILGEKFILVGNIDPIKVLRDGNQDEIIHAVKTCLDFGAEAKSGFILAPGCQVHLETREENLLAFKNAVLKYGTKAQRGLKPQGLDKEKSRL